jgi:hypothetical protein
LTVAISVKVNDGVVLAADSASTITRGGQIINIYDNANKVFNLYKGLPVGAITWGSGNIGAVSISTIVKDFRLDLVAQDKAQGAGQFDAEHLSIEDVANRLAKYIETRFTPAFARGEVAPPLGFVVAGFSEGSDLAEEWQILFVEDGTLCGPFALRDRTAIGPAVFGQPEAFQRLAFGIDVIRAPIVLKKFGIDPAIAELTAQALRNDMEQNLAVASMPIQDAIELADFLVDLTAKYTRFKEGAATVGGPIDLAVITKHEDFKWIRRKHYYKMENNVPTKREGNA